MRQELETALQQSCKDLFNIDIQVELNRPDEQFGDYSTTVALQLAKKLSRDPKAVASEIADDIKARTANIQDVQVAGAGFLNIKITDAAFYQSTKNQQEKSLDGQNIVAEYSDPNPFKILHAGHLYTSIVGDAIANLLQAAGANVHRVNFGGDVGLHVGKTMWSIISKLDGENPEKLNDIPADKRSEWLASAYIDGTNAYEDNQNAKSEIVRLNKLVYQVHASDDHQSAFAQIYWTCRQWSYDYFDEFYDRIGVKFEKYYPESSVAELGLKTVKQNIGKVFSESDGAVVFKGEDYGLHTRVFINSEGLPTYEAKDVGLIMQKKQDYNFDKSVVITGNEQMQYMQVVIKAIEQFAPELATATTHLTHGLVKLQGGVKMSSRKGNVLRAVDVLDSAATANKTLSGKDDERVVLAAVKYAFLKQRLGGDIVYSPEDSVATEGNSGPYLQYAHARARSILAKAKTEQENYQIADELMAEERTLLRKISEFSEVMQKATAELAPHHVCTYLYELAQTFNRFYEKNRVIDDDRQMIRLGLVKNYADTLKTGLSILGITAIDKM